MTAESATETDYKDPKIGRKVLLTRDLLRSLRNEQLQQLYEANMPQPSGTKLSFFLIISVVGLPIWLIWATVYSALYFPRMFRIQAELDEEWRASLKKLQKLCESGTLSEEEFQAKEQQIMEKRPPAESPNAQLTSAMVSYRCRKSRKLELTPQFLASLTDKQIEDLDSANIWAPSDYLIMLVLIISIVGWPIFPFWLVGRLAQGFRRSFRIDDEKDRRKAAKKDLKKLVQLRDEGVLTREEFEEKQRQLMGCPSTEPDAVPQRKAA